MRDIFWQYQQKAEPLLPPAAPPEVPSSASWQGSRPESLRRKLLAAALIPSFFWSGFTPIAAVPAQPYPVYPSAITRRAYPTSEQEASFWVPGLPNLPVPPLSWAPEYPDRLSRAATL